MESRLARVANARHLRYFFMKGKLAAGYGGVVKSIYREPSDEKVSAATCAAVSLKKAASSWTDCPGRMSPKFAG